MQAYCSIFFMASFLISILCFNSCKLTQENEIENSVHSENDFVDHLLFATEQYIKNHPQAFIKPPKDVSNYLEGQYRFFAKRNEIILPPLAQINFHLIKTNHPYYFSMPNGNIFLSIGLLQKFIRHEGDLRAILVVEFIKSFKNLYLKKILYPKKRFYLQNLIDFSHISLDDEILIRKWGYYIIKRSGLDPYIMILWSQQENKNGQLFYSMRNYEKEGSKIEYFFKNFLIDKGDSDKLNKLKRNSTREYYHFHQWVMSIKIQKEVEL